MGNEPGVAEAAEEFGCIHIPDVLCNKHGTPLLHDILQKGKAAASHPLLCYINADILLPPSILEAVCIVKKRLQEFLIVGRRWDTDVRGPLSFDGDWPSRLEQIRLRGGVLGTPGAIDYFISPKELFTDMPPFAIGRLAWDSWLLNSATSRKIPLVDATRVVPIVHQNHDYAHLKGADRHTKKIMTPECIRNQALFLDDFMVLDHSYCSALAAQWFLVRIRGRLYVAPNITKDRLLSLWATVKRKLRMKCKKNFAYWYGKRRINIAIRFLRGFLQRNTAQKPGEITVFIVSHNQEKHLRRLWVWLAAIYRRKIIIVDNASDCPHLLKFFKRVPCEVIRLPKDLGHMAVWKCGLFDDILLKQAYVVVDCNTMPSADCPADVIKHLHKILYTSPRLARVSLSLTSAEQLDAVDAAFTIYRSGVFPDNERWDNAARTTAPYTAINLLKGEEQ
ncbi:MAG: hypothetical protein DELT_01383 [Desulfovibrio sp.]